MLTLRILEEFLREEGFEINAIDDFDGDPTDFVRQHTPWQAVGINLTHSTSGAVEIVRDPPGLYVWTLDGQGPADVIARIPLAHPLCFEKVLEALREWNELISSKRLAR